jgi:thymidylate synthase
MSNQANEFYQQIIAHLMLSGEFIQTRNSDSYSCIDYPRIKFTHTPLVTIRKTAWKKALLEMQWFMSGDTKCPDELMDWWQGQLGHGNMYRGGYSNQFRYSGLVGTQINFDQIKYLLNGVRNNPNSRRLVATTWNPANMAAITELNANPQTPTTCHGSLIQLFVRDHQVHMTVYQRSADILLGVPHNWMQYWALLHYFAFHSKNEIGSLMWDFGDLHLYDEMSHLTTAKQIAHCTPDENSEHELVYTFSEEYLLGCPKFKASDFTMEGIVPQPIVLTRPKLLA